MIVGTNGEITSRKAIKKLALRCQCLRLWIFILIGLNTQNLADGEFVLHPLLRNFEQTLDKTLTPVFNGNNYARSGPSPNIH